MQEFAPQEPSLAEAYVPDIDSPIQYEILKHALMSEPLPELFEDEDCLRKLELRVYSAGALLKYAHKHELDKREHLKMFVDNASLLRVNQMIYSEAHDDVGVGYQAVETSKIICDVILRHPNYYAGHATTQLVVGAMANAVELEKRYWQAVPYVRRIIDQLAPSGLNREEDLEHLSELLYARAIAQSGKTDPRSIKKQILYLEAVQFLGPSIFDRRNDHVNERSTDQRIVAAINRAKQRRDNVT